MNEDEENLDEEGLNDPYESELKKEKEAENKRIEDAKDDLTEGKIKRARSRRGQGGDVKQLDLFEARSGLRTTAALGTEIFLNTLVDPVLEPGTQVAAGTAINWLAQRIRGGELSKGELAAAGLASLIPGGAQGRAITQFAKGAGKGALSGAIETAGMAGIDEGRLPTAEELAAGLGIGAAFGGILSTPQATKALQDLRGRIAGQYTPITAYAASKPIDTKDIPRNLASTWRTAGQKSQPLNFLFGDKAGWRGGLLNIKSWRERGADKNIAEQFLTAQGKGVVFSSEANKQNAFMSRVFGIEGAEQLLNLPKGSKRIFQAHHNTATKAVLTGQEGLTYDSPYYHEIQKVWEDLNLTLGNNPDNIIGTLGLVQRDLNSPHSLIHKFLDSKMGPDGTKFWTEDLMKQIVIYDDAGNAIGHKNFDLRLAKTKEQALIFKEAVDLLKLSHQQFYLAKGVKPGEYLTTEPILDEEIVDSFINKLPPKGGTGQYTTDVISRIAREVAQETDIKPVIKSGSLKQLIEEQVADDVRAKLDGMYRFAVNQSNGEDMLIDVIFNNMKPIDAIRKYRGNDPAADLLEKELKEAVRYNRQRLKQLYQMKFGELPSAVTKFDKGADD